MKRVLQGKEVWPKRDKKTQESVVESIVRLWEMGHTFPKGRRKDVIGAGGMVRKRGSISPGKAEGLRWQGWWRGCLVKEEGAFTLWSGG